MRHFLAPALSTLLLLAAAVVAAPAAPAQDGPTRPYIVVYKDRVDPGAATTRLERRNTFTSRFRFSHAIRGFAASLTAQERAAVESDPEVAYVTEDLPARLVALDTAVRRGESVPTGVRRIVGATATTAHRAADVAVAVIDTGVNLYSNQLTVSRGKNCIGVATSNDQNGHGTHVAGTIGAKNNGSGVLGVAPGTRVYSVRVLDARGSGTMSSVICGIEWVTANAKSKNIKVANMSLGVNLPGGGTCAQNLTDPLHQAICRSIANAGVTYVVAAGNSGQDLAGSVPAAYPEVLTVTALSDSDGAPGGGGGVPTCRDGEGDDVPATFSNYATGPDALAHTIAAPGVCIDSTWLANGRRTISGTSMAAPHVAAVVALCIKTGGKNGPCAGKSPAAIIEQLRGDAATQVGTANPGYGYTGDTDRYGNLVYAGGY